MGKQSSEKTENIQLVIQSKNNLTNRINILAQISCRGFHGGKNVYFQKIFSQLSLSCSLIDDTASSSLTESVKDAFLNDFQL